MAEFGKDARIAFVGAGMVGKSLAVVLAQHGYKVVAASSRTFSSTQALASLVPGCVAYATPAEAADAADLVFITSPDDAIGAIAASIAWRPGQGVVHCSGVASLDALEPARSRGAVPGTFHPLQTFSDVEVAVRTIPGVTFAIEGGPDMRAALKDVAIELGGNPIFLRAEDKPLYHASVVIVGGLMTGMAGAVADLWSHFGIGRADALRALVPIMQGNVVTLESVGVPGAVAGPYVRGDIGTVAKHLDTLRSTAPEMLPVYCEMALAGLPYAFEKGNVPEERAGDIRELLVAASRGLATADKDQPSL